MGVTLYLNEPKWLTEARDAATDAVLDVLELERRLKRAEAIMEATGRHYSNEHDRAEREGRRTATAEEIYEHALVHDTHAKRFREIQKI